MPPSRKRQPPIPPLRIAFVTWYDHYSVTGWHEGTEIAAESPSDGKGLMCVSVGILAHEDENIVKLSTAWAPDNGFGDLMCILRPNIDQMLTVPLRDYIKGLRAGMKNAIMQDASQPVSAKESKVKPKKPKPKC